MKSLTCWQPQMNNTYHQCLSLLNQCKTLKAVKQIHASLLKTAPGLDAFSAGKLLLHCAVTISDSLDYARRFFLHFPNPDVFMYNTLVRGFSESDKPQNSITTFIEMRRKCLDPPDSFSFAFVLKAAANLRSLKSGIQLHCQALVHGLDGHLFVGTTLISMYGECERADLSMKVFDEMSDPNVVVWNAVVTACFRSGDVKNAERVFNKMPFWNLTTWNVMLAGYMKAGELELARKVFMAMEMKDDVSWSTMIVGFAQNGCYHEAFGFFRELLRVGTRPNELREIMHRLRVEEGYVPEVGSVLHDIEEEEKEDSVSKHSEKLALAFGIARMCKGKAIRIVKNLRICRDCHTVMKLISKVYGLEIVVRDRSRFHSFMDGSCSCRDYCKLKTQVVLLQAPSTVSPSTVCLNTFHTYFSDSSSHGIHCNILNLFAFFFHSYTQTLHTIFPSKTLLSKTHFSQGFFNFSRLLYPLSPRKKRGPIKDWQWQWKFKDSSINIYYEEHERESSDSTKNILMIPTISDVSTVEEWRSVAKDIAQRDGKVNWRATIVDWPGLGYSDRPKMDYNADVMEKFVVDFINVPENDLVVFGGGHAATITVRAAKKGLVKPAAIAAVAPTWAGPLPIVFDRDSSMETR
ncbi:hypothetical protein Pint_16109 [Pistacia integerrima]|uniref:Uncharacterized protein n=1 Tax=Pistacia integerrima TaxID=434235 RepID=A0ACC0ZG07_9ROSI|nr:hypothetical protein Pint_16109 [Pistacia integerrima]